MKLPILALAALAIAPLAQAETLHCHGYQVASEPEITVKGTVKFKEGKPFDVALLIEPLGKNGWTYFFGWSEVRKDGSNFASWFDFESKGDNIMIEGLYAGLSPELTESYPLYRAILEGTPFDGMPKRTLIIFGADRKPFAETFCYENMPKPRAELP